MAPHFHAIAVPCRDRTEARPHPFMGLGFSPDSLKCGIIAFAPIIGLFMPPLVFKHFPFSIG